MTGAVVKRLTDTNDTCPMCGFPAWSAGTPTMDCSNHGCENHECGWTTCQDGIKGLPVPDLAPRLDSDETTLPMWWINGKDWDIK